MEDRLEEVQLVDGGQQSRSRQEVLRRLNETLLFVHSQSVLSIKSDFMFLTSLAICRTGLPPGLSDFEGILTWKIKNKLKLHIRKTNMFVLLNETSGVMFNLRPPVTRFLFAVACSCI